MWENIKKKTYWKHMGRDWEISEAMGKWWSIMICLLWFQFLEGWGYTHFMIISYTRREDDNVNHQMFTLSSGLGKCPFLVIGFTSPRQTCVGDLSPRVRRCETWGHLPTSAHRFLKKYKPLQRSWDLSLHSNSILRKSSNVGGLVGTSVLFSH